jgi:transposase
MRRRRKRYHISKQGGQRLAAELRGEDLGRVLIVPIDGGKGSHKALIANGFGDIVRDSFEFGNDLSGAVLLDEEVQKAAGQVEAERILLGIEPTGHYVENLVQEMLMRNYEVRQINPLAVRCEREAGLTWCKTDELDLCAMGQLLLNGKGRMAGRTTAVYYNLRHAVRARRSSVKRRASLRVQIHSYMDRLFPGLFGSKIFSDPFGVSSLALIRHYGSARRVKRCGRRRVGRWLALRGVRQAEEKAAALHELAGQCLLLPATAEEALLQALRFRLEEYQLLSKQILRWEACMAEYLLETPGIWLLSIREINVPSAAEYIGELGPLELYEKPGNIIGRAGLVPKTIQSASSRWQGGITKLGHARLRYCLCLIGRNLIRRNTYFGRFYRRLVEQSGKEPQVAKIAVACKFVRISWAKMKHKGKFVSSAQDDLDEDIEMKYKTFLHAIDAAQLYRSKLCPRLKRVLQAGGLPRRNSPERASDRRVAAMGPKLPDPASPSQVAGNHAHPMGLSGSWPNPDNVSHISEILKTLPVLRR